MTGGIFRNTRSANGGNVDGRTFDLMERFGGLKGTKIGDRQAIATALGKLLHRALESLLRKEDAGIGRMFSAQEEARISRAFLRRLDSERGPG